MDTLVGFCVFRGFLWGVVCLMGIRGVWLFAFGKREARRLWRVSRVVAFIRSILLG